MWASETMGLQDIKVLTLNEDCLNSKDCFD
jgi:hypothetical protein